jgi:hypothetical protein
MPGAAANPHPGNDYFVQPTTGTIQRQSNPAFQKVLEAAGFQGPMTWDQAQGVIELNKKARGQGTPAAGVPGPGSLVGGWIGSLGGMIASGLEGALVAFLKDLWDVILGPLEVIAGVALAILILLFAFKDDLASVAAIMIK